MKTKINSDKFILNGKLVDLKKCISGNWKGRNKSENTFYKPRYIRNFSSWSEVYKTTNGAYILVDRWWGCCSEGYAQFVSEEYVKQFIGGQDADAFIELFNEAMEEA